MMKTGHTLLAVSSVDADSENPKLVVTCHYLHIDNQVLLVLTSLPLHFVSPPLRRRR